MEPSKPHENNKRDLYEALALAERLEACEIRDKSGHVKGYMTEEGLDIKDMMRAVVILAQVYRGRLNIPQLCKDHGIEAKVVTTPEPFPAPSVKEEELVLAKETPPLNARPASPYWPNAHACERRHGKIPSIPF